MTSKKVSKTSILYRWIPSYHSGKCSLVSKRIACTSSFKHQLMVGLFRAVSMSRTISLTRCSEGLSTKDAGEEERRDQIPVLHKSTRFLFLFPSLSNRQHLTGFQNVISRILKAAAPADSAKSSNYLKSQIAYSIYDGRYKASKPRTSIAPPVQLFHPVFGHFLDSVKSTCALPDDIIHQTAEYMKAASAIYESEEDRRITLTPLLCDILDVNIQTILNEDKTNPDGMVEEVKNRLLFLIFLKEDKNEFGDGGSDPSTQAGLSAARSWSQSRVCQIHCIVFRLFICLFLSIRLFETLLSVPHFS